MKFSKQLIEDAQSHAWRNIALSRAGMRMSDNDFTVACMDFRAVELKRLGEERFEAMYKHAWNIDVLIRRVEKKENRRLKKAEIYSVVEIYFRNAE